MIGCRADGLRSLRERYAVVARRACEKPISRRGKRVNDNNRTEQQWAWPTTLANVKDFGSTLTGAARGGRSGSPFLPLFGPLLDFLPF